MNPTDVNFITAFEDVLVENRAIFQHDDDNIYSIALKTIPDRIITARIIGSEPIDEKIHGSKNDTEIKAIGYFKFKLSLEGYEPDFYVFGFFNTSDEKVEFAVVPYVELKKRLELRKNFNYTDHWVDLKFWLVPEDNLIETTNIGFEGEFWLVGGRFYKHMRLDYTKFLNDWNMLL